MTKPELDRRDFIKGAVVGGAAAAGGTAALATSDIAQAQQPAPATATAAPPVRQEIVKRLGLRDPAVVIGDFDRPNISLSARRLRTVADQHDELTSTVTRTTRVMAATI